MQTSRVFSYAAIVLISLGTFFGISNKVFAAVEQRCDELGANCVCSEPLQTTVFNQINTYFWDAADTTTTDKQCHTIVSSPGYEGTLISHGSRIWNSLNSGPAWNALPPGHSLKFIQLNDEGPTGSFSLQHSWATDPIPTARRAQRLYLYYTPNFVFSEDWNNNVLPGVDCQNSGKTIQLSERGGGILTFNSDRWNVHAWAYLYDGVRSFWGGSPTDQPQLGATGQGLTMVSADFKGKWWRYEVVYRNLPGPKTIVEVYLKNVTDNTPEFKILDTALPRIYTDQWGNQTVWTQSQADNLSLAQGGWDMFWDLFRNPQPGRDNCAGAYGFTEFAAAAWDTDAGQRIGAACEVEGGCGTSTPTPDTTPPSIPSGLSATSISATQINLSWTASTDSVGVSGYRIYRNGTQIATAAGTSYANTSLTASTAYSYTVSAYDASNNTSAQSASASATTQATPVVSTTPIGLWTFDTTDLTTTTALDTSGLANTLTLINNPTRITGKVNQALSFDGIASTAFCTDASCGGTTKLDMGTSDWTVSAWVKTAPAATGNIVTKSGFICGGNPDGWTVYISGTGTLQAGLNDSAAGCVFSPSDGAIINNGSWHHITTVFNRAGNVVRYVDGIQTGTTASIASLSGVSIDSSAEFRIGSRDATGDSGFLSGAIDDVRIYPRALSLSEIQALSAAGTPAPVSDTTAPTTPTSLTATAISTTQINLSWSTSTDNIGVTGYRIYRNGTQIATSATNSYSNTGLSASTAYSYTIAAYDAAGNASVQSASASATTQASVPVSSAGQYFNSSEPMCNGTDPSVLFCDDFEDGDWYVTNELNGGGGRFNPINDGWLGNTFAPLDSQGYGRCGLLGSAGTNCTSTSGNRSGALAEGFHYFAPSETVYDEIYHRFYVKFSPGYKFGHEKLVFYQQSDSGGSTEQVAVLMTPFGNNTFDYTVMLPDIRAGQNQGNNLNFIPGHWYYMEVHIRLDSPMGAGNGLIETWADDCGIDGKGCTGPGTLRQVYAGNIRPSANKGLGVIWQENWSNSSTMTAVGEVYNDQVIARTTRIGPMAVSGTPTSDTTAPSAPIGLSAITISTTQVNLSWTAVTDNVGIAGYKIYRNGTQIA
ncbi:MAG: LamG-like jellyroll fold domain-containing protein, partial [bacterium]|nr:LamG-like jellyroll fold domain-containing protein [bacterium]